MIPSSKKRALNTNSIWMAVDDQLQPEGKMINSWSIHSLNYKTRRCDRIVIESEKNSNKS